MSDDPQLTPPPTPPDKPPAGEGAQDLAYWQQEAKKAFAARDQIRAELKRLQAAGLTEQEREEYQRLKEAEARAEEERKRKAGEFDSWRAQITKQHEEQLTKIQQEREAAIAALKQERIGRAFADATDWFGPSGKTIYQPHVAALVLGTHVQMEDDGTVVVRDRDGHVILDPKTGKPAPFATAIGTLIASLPDRDHHLRGSGRAGSGSAGGADHPQTSADLDALIQRARAGDKDALSALRQRHAAAGGIVYGAAFQRK